MSKVKNHNYAQYDPHTIRASCPCGDSIETDSAQEYGRWGIAHAHHRTAKARAHFHDSQIQRGLPTKPHRPRRAGGNNP